MKMSLGEIELLTNKLVRMSESCKEPVDSEYRSVFANVNRPVAREIGQRLHELGGYNLMLEIYKKIPKHDQLELSYAWDGVGIWEV